MNKTHKPTHGGYPNPNYFWRTHIRRFVFESTPGIKIVPGLEKNEFRLIDAGGRVQEIENQNTTDQHGYQQQYSPNKANLLVDQWWSQYGDRNIT